MSKTKKYVVAIKINLTWVGDYYCTSCNTIEEAEKAKQFYNKILAPIDNDYEPCEIYTKEELQL